MFSLEATPKATRMSLLKEKKKKYTSTEEGKKKRTPSMRERSRRPDKIKKKGK
jgi:hypothetical protein